MAKPKLIHVAQKASVSLTTASMALSGKGKISREVRECVLQAASTLGYQKREPRQEPQADAPRTITILLPVDEEWSHVFHFSPTKPKQPTLSLTRKAAQAGRG